MNRITRILSAALSLSLVLSAPGLAPYQAAAQTIGSARAYSRAVPPGGAAVVGLDGIGSILPAASLRAGLTLSLAPSAALTPVLSAPASAVTVAPSAASPSALKAASRTAVPVRALASLQGGTNAARAAVKAGSAEAPRDALNGLFEGAAVRSESLAVSAFSAASAEPRLDRPVLAPRSGRRAPKAAPPATSLKRTFSAGFLAGVIPIAITMGGIHVAELLGYRLHSNYQGPSMGGTPSLLGALALWFGAAVMAPISEEALFRDGIQGWLAKMLKHLRVGSFIIPALITSFVFVAMHETSDPLLFALRMADALILSYVYHKEGILAAMAAHGFFNGLLALSMILAAVGLPWPGLAIMPAALYFTWKAAGVLRAQKPAIASGALAPKPLSGRLSILLAAVLLLGYFTIMPNAIWVAGAVVLFMSGMAKLEGD